MITPNAKFKPNANSKAVFAVAQKENAFLWWSIQILDWHQRGEGERKTKQVIRTFVTWTSPPGLTYDRHNSPSSEYCTTYSVTNSFVCGRPSVAILLIVRVSPKSNVKKWKYVFSIGVHEAFPLRFFFFGYDKCISIAISVVFHCFFFDSKCANWGERSCC